MGSAGSWNTGIPHLPGLMPNHISSETGDRINHHLMNWIDEMGLFPGRRDIIETTNFGRYTTLCFQDTEDENRLLAIARCIAVFFAVDDYYGDEKECGSMPELTGSRLALVLTSIDFSGLVNPFVEAYERNIDDDPILRSLRMSFSNLSLFSTSSQIARLRSEFSALLVGMAAEASWLLRGQAPSVWEYLAQRRINSFLPCIALIDVAGDYELPAEIYYSKNLRRAIVLAANMSTLANDFYSADKEIRNNPDTFNLPTLLCTEYRCSLDEAMQIVMKIYSESARAYDLAERDILASTESSASVVRYLDGVRKFMIGNLEWHRTSCRYRTEVAAQIRTAG